MIDWQMVFAWVIAVNGACVAACSLWLAVHFLRHSPGPADSTERSWQKAAYNVAFTLAVILLVTVAVWDTAHPDEQFPYNVRMAFTIPMLVLADFSLFGRVWVRK